MSTVQDRLRQTRIPLDKWSTREQMCLASAVSCSGDQNWMSVSRTMKLVCGTAVNSVPQPSDWYSQKSCAVQYGHLLENVETPKRKKRTSESTSGSDTPTTVETPTDLVLRKLTEERMQELKNEIRKNQEEYAKLYREVKELQAGNASEERLLAMWHEMETEEEAKTAEKAKLEQELHEREQRKQELQRNWRTATPTTTTVKAVASTTTVELKAVTIEKNRPPLLNIQSDAAIITTTTTTTPTTATVQQQPQTSPLLSSLLKSPTSNAPSITSSTHVASVARTTAPTITNLLTGGSISIKQPVVIIKNTDMGQMLTRPASGPPSEQANLAQNLLSPSQSAPTLSMLLEKNKSTTAITNVEIKVKKEQIDEGKLQVQHATTSEVIEAVEQMNVEETMEKVKENELENSMEVEETDPNEEQQLLEVFKNIGNIELEIDAAFLTAMDEEPHGDNNSDITENFDTKLEKAVLETVENIAVTEKEEQQQQQEEQPVLVTKESSFKQEEPAKERAGKVLEEHVKPEKIKERVTVVTSSSDDSSDNVPLSTVANELEAKEAANAAEDAKEMQQTELATKSEVAEKNVEDLTNIEEVVIVETTKVEEKLEKNAGIIEIKEEEPECKIEQQNDVQVTETVNVEEMKQETITTIKEEPQEVKEDKATSSKNAKSVKDEIKPSKSEVVKKEEGEEKIITIEVIPITDTDTDSSCTPDVEKFCNLEPKPPAANERIKTERTNASEDSDSTPLPATPSLPPTVTPARPPVLRKLRERDRSESPMIVDTDDSEHVGGTSTRLRRRASSTPIIDSVPNSPASVSDREDRELRTASKKSLFSIFNSMQQKHGKEIGLLEKSFSENCDESKGAKYEEACLRPMDFQVMQQNIESGSIRSTLELQRDILLMCQNAIMLNPHDTERYGAAMAIKQDCRNLSDLCQLDKIGTEKETKDKEARLSTSSNATSIKSRSGFRKSQRIT